MGNNEMVPQENRREVSPWTAAGFPFASLHREMDRLFDEVARGWGVVPFRRTSAEWGALSPRVNVAETEKEVRVTADLPGTDEKDIEVHLTGDVLTIKGEKKADHEDKSENYHRVERTEGAFERALALPAEVDPAQVTAVFKKGVLTVTLAKTPAAQTHARKIDVKGE